MRMWMRTTAVVCVIAVFGCTAAFAQEAAEIEALGESMEIAAEEGEFDEAFSRADTIIEAQPDEPSELSAEQQYWVGNAYKIKMAQYLQMAKNDLTDEEQATFADGMSDWILSPDVRTIARGEEVNLEDYLIDGKIVIFDFFSDFSGPSMQISPAVEALTRARDDIALVKVNINRPDVEQVDLDSPVAQQYEIEELPHFKIYGPDGDMMAEGEEAQDTIIQWLQELQAQHQQQQQQQQEQQQQQQQEQQQQQQPQPQQP
ncbi:MAG: thioredoxin domain-containing protein [Armatimonadota bacterium]